MSPPADRSNIADRCFPRVGGDEPAIETVWVVSDQFSPRERG